MIIKLSGLVRFGKGQRGILGEYLYTHFFSNDCEGLKDVCITIVNKTDINIPIEREGFWAYKHNTIYPTGLNLCDIF